MANTGDPTCRYCGQYFYGPGECPCIRRVIMHNFQDFWIEGEWKVFGPEISGAGARMAAMWEVEPIG